MVLTIAKLKNIVVGSIEINVNEWMMLLLGADWKRGTTILMRGEQGEISKYQGDLAELLLFGKSGFIDICTKFSDYCIIII